jgi:hypothetical protein
VCPRAWTLASLHVLGRVDESVSVHARIFCGVTATRASGQCVDNGTARCPRGRRHSVRCLLSVVCCNVICCALPVATCSVVCCATCIVCCMAATDVAVVCDRRACRDTCACCVHAMRARGSDVSGCDTVADICTTCCLCTAGGNIAGFRSPSSTAALPCRALPCPAPQRSLPVECLSSAVKDPFGQCAKVRLAPPHSTLQAVVLAAALQTGVSALFGSARLQVHLLQNGNGRVCAVLLLDLLRILWRVPAHHVHPPSVK